MLGRMSFMKVLVRSTAGLFDPSGIFISKAMVTRFSPKAPPIFSESCFHSSRMSFAAKKRYPISAVKARCAMMRVIDSMFLSIVTFLGERNEKTGAPEGECSGLIIAPRRKKDLQNAASAHRRRVLHTDLDSSV